MDVILLEHVDNLGTVGQTVKVKDGYARNFLFPRKLACQASEKNLRFYRSLIEAKQRKLSKLKESAETLAKKLAGVTLTFYRKSRDQEARLFGSVTNVDVAVALEAQGFEIDRKRVFLTAPIKKLGEYEAIVRLHPQVKATVKVIVQPEEEATNVS